jgi:hypothetical protein
MTFVMGIGCFANKFLFEKFMKRGFAALIKQNIQFRAVFEY